MSLRSSKHMRRGLRMTALAAAFIAAPAQAKNWVGTGTGNWNLNTNWSPAALPTAGEAVNIVHTDGNARTVVYNVGAPSLGLLAIDLTGPGTAATTLSMPNNFNLAANGILVGGFNGASFAETAGRAAVIQSGGTMSTNAGWDFVVGYGANSTGTYTLSGTGALTANQSEYIGLSGNGTVNHSAGTNTAASASGFFILGLNAGSSGTYNLSGTGTLTSNTNERIGDIGTGSFVQTGGTNNINGAKSLYLGFSVGGVGNYSLSGTGTLNNTASQFVGNNGTGTFTQNGGTNTFTSGGLFIGTNAGSSGTYNLGAGSLLPKGNVHVGVAGTGTFTQNGGTHTIVTGSLNVGTSAGSMGSYTLTAGTLSTDFGEQIGNAGTGTFTQSGGTNTSPNSLFIGLAASGNGTYALSGGTFNANLHEFIGSAGTGTFNHSGGTHNRTTVNSDLWLGHDANAVGTYNLSAAGIISSNTRTYVGNNGSGTFNQTGGTHNMTSAANGLYIGYGPTGTGTYTLSGDGALSVAGTEYVGYQGNGTFTQSGGTHNMTSAANVLFIAFNPASVGAYNLSGTGSLSVAGSEVVGVAGAGTFTQMGGTHTVGVNLLFGTVGGASGTYNLSGGSLTVNQEEQVGAGNTSVNSFTQTGGTHTVGTSAGALRVAYNAGSIASFSLSGGSLTVNGGEYVAWLGSGTFTQTGGTHTIVSSGDPTFANLSIAAVAGGSGTYSLSGSGALNVTGGIYVGGRVIGAGGAGVMNLTGGTATASGAMKVWNTTGTAVNLNGGTLSVGSLDTDGNPSRFNWTAGALHLTGSSLTIGSAGPLGTALTLDAAKVLSVSGTTTIDPFRTLTLSGGTLSTTNLLNNGTFNFTSGTLGITGGSGLTFGTGGALGANYSLTAGRNIQVTNTTTVASSGILHMNGGSLTATGGITNNGEIQFLDTTSQLTGGTLTNNKLVTGNGRVDNNVTNAAGAEIRAAGTQRLTFTGASNTNAGKINLVNGGTVEFTQTLTNNASGLITGRGALITAGLTNNGQMQFAGGLTDVYGPVTGTSGSKVIVSGASNSAFYDAVTMQNGSEFRVSTGSVATFFGNVLGTNNFTGSGTKIFEGATATLDQLATGTGDTVVELSATLTANRISEDSLTINGLAVIAEASPNGYDPGNNIYPQGSNASGSEVNSLTITATGVLDLGNSDLAIDHVDGSDSAIDQVRDLLTAGYNGGGWDGTGGIVSNTLSVNNPNQLDPSTFALGYAENIDLPSPYSTTAESNAFFGIDVDDSTTLIKFTWVGDLNLDGLVDFQDLSVFNTNYDNGASSGRYWFEGDFNYDGFIDFQDLSLFNTNYDPSKPSLPEPGTLSVLSVLSLRMGRRHRRSA